jgi:DNA polymerase-3 subunit delta'
MIPQPAGEAPFAAALDGGRAAGSWLIEGPDGVGKATLAFRIARRVLASDTGGNGRAGLDSDVDDPGTRKVRAGSHPDLLVVDSTTDGKGDSGEIPVDTIRRIAPFLHLTPALGRWRVVIVDEADQMNRNAANALLKLLEEPPGRSLILLVAARAGLLPATVRSRCRRLRLAPLGREAMTGFLAERLPALEAAEREQVLALADGSPGRALRLAEAGGPALWRDVLDRLGSLPRLDWAAVDRLADRVAAKGGDAAWRLFTELHLRALGQAAHAAARSDAPAAGVPDAALFQRLATAAPLERWVALWDNTAALWERTRIANLDRRQAVLGAYGLVEDALARG